MKGEPKVRLWMQLTRQHEQNSQFAAQQALKLVDELSKAKQVKFRLTPECRRLWELAGEKP